MLIYGLLSAVFLSLLLAAGFAPVMNRRRFRWSALSLGWIAALVISWLAAVALLVVPDITSSARSDAVIIAGAAMMTVALCLTWSRRQIPIGVSVALISYFIMTLLMLLAAVFTVYAANRIL